MRSEAERNGASKQYSGKRVNVAVCGFSGESNGLALPWGRTSRGLGAADGFLQRIILSLTKIAQWHISARYATFQPVFCVSFFIFEELQAGMWERAAMPPEPHTAGYEPLGFRELLLS